MVALIQTLNSKGYTYEKEGSIYFRIAQFKDYGKLSKLDAEGIMAGARVDVDEYGKQDARDFVLWKATKNGEPHWETALGPGRPGWHVECSAMSMKYLGESFDLHCGAVDLVFPHHENEIAQSEAATEKPFVRYWMHGEHLIVEGEKMSKSKGNFYTLRDLAEKGIDPLAVRYALQSVPYRRQLNFTFDLLHQAGKSLARLQDFKLRLTTEKLKLGSSQKVRETTTAALQNFERAMDDDLNTAQALAAVFDWVRDLNVELSEGRFFEDDRQTALDALERFNQVLELWRSDNEEINKKSGVSSSSALRRDSPATSRWPTRSVNRFMNWVTSSRTPRKASAGKSGRRTAPGIAGKANHRDVGAQRERERGKALTPVKRFPRSDLISGGDSGAPRAMSALLRGLLSSNPTWSLCLCGWLGCRVCPLE